MVAILTSHIQLDDAGVAWIDDTNTKVIEVALDRISHGTSPEEIHFQYPHLSLAQIHAALSYYYDHQAAFDQVIREQLTRADALATQTRDSPIRRRIKAQGQRD